MHEMLHAYAKEDMFKYDLGNYDECPKNFGLNSQISIVLWYNIRYKNTHFLPERLKNILEVYL